MQWKSHIVDKSPFGRVIIDRLFSAVHNLLLQTGLHCPSELDSSTPLIGEFAVEVFRKRLSPGNLTGGVWDVDNPRRHLAIYYDTEHQMKAR